MKNERNKKKSYLILLIVLICFHLINNLLFLKEHPLPEGKDSYAHCNTFINFSQIAKTGAAHPFYMQDKGFLYNLIFISFDYPPLFYFVAYLLNVFLSIISINAALFTSSLFLVILLMSVYKIGLRTNENIGILAAFICSFYPIIHQFSRYFSLELAVCAMVALTIWMLIATRLFENRFFSICLGISLGLGMLTKQTFIIYIIGPYLFYIVKSLNGANKSRCNRKSKIKNILISVVIGSVCSFVFYWNYLIYESVFCRADFMGAVDSNNIFSMAHLLYYPFSLRKTIGTFFVIAFLAGFINLRIQKKGDILILIIWLLSPIVFLSFFTLKYAEYTIPVLPAAALITSVGIFSIRKKLIRNGLIASVVVFSFIFYFQSFFGFSKTDYSSYDIDKQYRFVSLNMEGIEKDDRRLVKEVIKEIGNRNINVGICYDNKDLFFPIFFMKRFFSLTKMNSSIVNFSFNTTTFFNNIDRFDVLIYVTRSRKKWLTEKSFTKFIDEYNECHNTRIVFNKTFSNDYIYADRKLISVADNLVYKLLHLNKKFDQYCYMRFFNEVASSYENVYIYKRDK